MEIGIWSEEGSGVGVQASRQVGGFVDVMRSFGVGMGMSGLG